MLEYKLNDLREAICMDWPDGRFTQETVQKIIEDARACGRLREVKCAMEYVFTDAEYEAWRKKLRSLP